MGGPADHRVDVGGRGDPARRGRGAGLEEVVAAEAAHVVLEHPHGHRVRARIVGRYPEEGEHTRVEGDRPGREHFAQERDRDRLADARLPVPRGRQHRLARLDVAHAVAARVDELSAADDRERSARVALRDQVFHRTIERRQPIRGGLGPADRSGCRAQDERERDESVGVPGQTTERRASRSESEALIEHARARGHARLTRGGHDRSG